MNNAKELENKRVYITTAIPYVNAKPHIGTALDYIYADTLARYFRQKGSEVFLQVGTDEHGQKIERTAVELGVTPQEHVDELFASFRSAVDALNISYTDFIRTTDERHAIAAHTFWKKAVDAGAIYKDSYEGLYCVGCEEFKTEKELDDEGLCPNHKKAPEVIQEENYFFRLSVYGEKLLALYEKQPDFVIPGSRFNEMKEIVKSGLEDLSISREKAKMSWGVPVPDDDDQVMYVWFEALLNYLSVIGYGTDDALFEKWWPAAYEFIGKDINRFHSVMWPAMLMAVDMALPEHIAVHGFISVEGQKMSKSLGNVVDPIELVEQYSVDAVRYYFLREIPFYNDGDFSEARFYERYTADLANGIGNLVSRVTNMIEKYFDGVLEAESREEGYIQPYEKKYHQNMQELRFERALQAVWELIADANEYIDQTKPWEMAKTDEEALRGVLSHLLYTITIIQEWLVPFLPETAERIHDAISGERITKSEPLFPRLGPVTK